MNRVTPRPHLTLVPEAVDVDEELERLIRVQADRLATATTRNERLDAQEQLQLLHSLRSPEQIAKMERRFLK